MKKFKVIHAKNLPGKLPIYPTIITWLALDHWRAPEWLYGSFAFLGGLMWALCVIKIIHQQTEDIFKEDNTQ